MDRLLKIVGGLEKAIGKAVKIFFSVNVLAMYILCYELQTKFRDTISEKDGLCLIIGYSVGS